MIKNIFKKSPLHIKIFLITILILSFGFYTNIFAIGGLPPLGGYNPGTELDPDCDPGDVDCIVKITSGSSVWSQSGDNIYYDSGMVGIGTNNPTSALDIVLTPTTTYTQEFIEEDGNNDSLDDATFSGTYTGIGSNIIGIWIDSEGTPDTFSYTDDNGDCPEVNNVPITGATQSLCFGISVTIANTTGHSMADMWLYNIEEVNPNPISIKDGADKNIFNINLDNNNFFVGFQSGYQSNGVFDSNFLGNSAGYSAIDASFSNFFGLNSGYEASYANYSNFLGNSAGHSATNAYSSNFLGPSAGQFATGASYSNFLGNSAGASATNAPYSNFLGLNTGASATNAIGSNFFGAGAGASATNASYSNFVGYNAGSSASNASNSIFIGQFSGVNDTVNNTTDPDDWSILLGYNTKTGGFKNSILLGGASSSTPIVNTKANQFMLAPSITELRWRGIDYTLPVSQGGASTVLTNNGSGGLSWTTPSSGSLLSDAEFNTKGGTNAGQNLVVGARYNTFLGYEAGKGGVITNAADDNTAIGAQSLYLLTTGYSNTATGLYSLYSNTSGYVNTAYGGYSLSTNSTGWGNSAYGTDSMLYNTTGSSNVAVGNMAFQYNTTGSSNTVVGAESLSAVSGGNNTALGYSAGSFLANGVTLNGLASNSLYLGSNTKALADNGQNEIVIGYNAIGNGSNTATIGNTSLLRTYLAGVNLKAGTATAGTAPLKFTAGTLLTIPESGAIEFDGTHFYGTVGSTRYQLDQQSGAGSQWTTDTNGITYTTGNVGIGTASSSMSALRIIPSDDYGIYITQPNVDAEGIRISAQNVAALFTTDYPTSTLTLAAITSSASLGGSIAVYGNNESNNSTPADPTFGGVFESPYGTGGIGVMATGSLADFRAPFSGIYQMKEQTSAATPPNNYGNIYFKTDGKIYAKNDGGTEYDLTATGSGLSSDADFNTKGGTDAGLNLVAGAQYNTFLGYEAGKGGVVTNATDYNTAVGSKSLFSLTTGNNNTAIGRASLMSNTTGYRNNSIGTLSLLSNTTGYRNTAIGYSSLYSNTTGYENVAIGENSLYYNTIGYANTAIGYLSLNETTTSQNTAVGYQSLASNTTGNANIALGYLSGFYVSTGGYNSTSSNSLYLGYDTRALADGDTNEIVIGFNAIGNGSNTTTIGTGNVLYVGGTSIGTDSKVARFTNNSGYCDITPVTGSISCSSDINLKKNIYTLNNEKFVLQTIEDADIEKTTLEKVLELTPVVYNWNKESDETNKHIGFIAQEMEQIFPNIVSIDDDSGLKSISYASITPYLVKAIQEMDLKIEGLSALDQNLEESFISMITNFFEEKIIAIKELVVKTLRIDGDVCVDDICISKDQFKQILIDNGGVDVDNQSNDQEQVQDDESEEHESIDSGSEGEDEEDGSIDSETLGEDEEVKTGEIAEEGDETSDENMADKNDLSDEAVEGEDGGGL